ncbi:hybrid sensor histidine kinase/response regulator [Granulosicoccus antarcticus]|nr:hybrid sensor histidine kinase/response regulator [Granulosicoccus antarcticus]
MAGPDDISGGRMKTRILLIDDDAAYVFLCKRYLRVDETFKHTVVSAGTVKEALAICELESFDCIVIDYRLPDDTGTEVIKQLRELLGLAMPPTIVFTADGGEEAAIEAVRSGANDFLAKRNVTQESLCRAVKNAIEKGMLRKSLMHRVSELEEANLLLRKRNEEIQRFYHTVSHEVKTPLTAIQEFVSIVFDGLAGPIEEEQKTILKYALESCDQISSHFNDLLELSRFETGKMTVNLKPSSMRDVFDHCIVAATPAALAKSISLTVADQPHQMPLVMMQSNRIIQVLSNLINNAIKFTDVGGEVVIESEVIKNGTRLRLSVRDNGCGIPAENTGMVFERLYQVNPANDQQNGPGMGLGLSIASEIANLHDSCLSVESELNVGSVFSFELNIAPAEELTDAA